MPQGGAPKELHGRPALASEPPACLLRRRRPVHRGAKLGRGRRRSRSERGAQGYRQLPAWTLFGVGRHGTMYNADGPGARQYRACVQGTELGKAATSCTAGTSPPKRWRRRGAAHSCHAAEHVRTACGAMGDGHTGIVLLDPRLGHIPRHEPALPTRQEPGLGLAHASRVCAQQTDPRMTRGPATLRHSSARRPGQAAEEAAHASQAMGHPPTMPGS